MLLNTYIGIIEENDLLDGLYKNTAKMELIQTGFVLDIFRLRPEFTYVLVIHDPSYVKKVQRNWETKKLYQKDIYNDKEMAELLNYSESDLCPPGLAAVHKGIPIAKKIIEEHAQKASSRLPYPL